MLKAFVNAFKIPDLRKKILFTLFIIAIFRLGSHVPVPIVDIKILQRAVKNNTGGFLSFINLFSGGALTNMAVFALGIMPYITSSIIMQLLTVVIPRLEQWQKQGEVGIKKITQWTRYMTVTLALLQSTGLVFLFHTGKRGFGQAGGVGVDIFPHGQFTAPHVALIVIILTAGTATIMWMGELVTQRGIGNGMSVMIFTSVISRLPQQGTAILQQAGAAKFYVILLIAMAIIVAVVFMEQGQRRIPVQYAKRVVGRRMYGGQSTYIPLKVNQAGVIPIIFAVSVLYFPQLLASTIHWAWLQHFVTNQLGTRGALYMVVYGLLVIFFAYFYTAITFNPVDTADNIRKYGGFVPGIRPGRPTADYLNNILVRITLPGSMFLAAIALIPYIVLNTWNIQQFPFGGTSILITVGVALETMKQLESQLLMRHYEGFLR
ncbi:MAG TPA: preprotein translocase subunit SecY [Actinomycetota bacterium]|nr:preprotein translocase subunit SecY [Actinomycetota bacterium]